MEGLFIGEGVGFWITKEQSDPICPELHVQLQPSCLFWSLVIPLPLQSLPEWQ
jgi:hypothetical protein